MKRPYLFAGTIAAIGGLSAFIFAPPHFTTALTAASKHATMPPSRTAEATYPIQDEGYQRSSAQDYSFEAKQSINGDEIESLHNYYSNSDFDVSGDRREIPDSYVKLMDMLTRGGFEQRRYMDEAGISLSGLRVRREVLQEYTMPARIGYYKNLLWAKQKFAPSDEEYKNVLNMLKLVQGDASYYLAGDLQTLTDYLVNAQHLHYTRLEIMSDMNGGYMSRMQQEANGDVPYGSDSTYHSALFRPASEPQGLGAREAVHKLVDYLADGKADIDVQLYPNPFSSQAQIDVLTAEISGMDVRIYSEQNGSLVKTLLREDAADAYTHLTWDGTNDSGVSMPDGFYTVVVSLPQVGYQGSFRLQRRSGS